MRRQHSELNNSVNSLASSSSEKELFGEEEVAEVEGDDKEGVEGLLLW